MSPAGLLCLLASVLLRVPSSVSSQKASLVVSPSWTQFLEYDSVLLSCEPLSSDGTVWRSTTDGSGHFLSWCTSTWGRLTVSGCELSLVKPADSGLYWCQSRYGDSSNSVNISVSRAGSVVLRGPVGPVTQGQDVTLLCQNRFGPVPADFFKGDVHTRVWTSPAGHMTIRNFSRSDEGQYKCRERELGESPPTWLLLDGSWGPVSLEVSPSSSQVFEYDNLTFSCGTRDWTVLRATRTEPPEQKLLLQTCGDKWGKSTPLGCFLHMSKPLDSGTYWCQSTRSQRSNAVNITVYSRSTGERTGERTGESTGPRVILEGLLHPLEAGDSVTLRCRSRDSSSSSGLPVKFYKDDQVLSSDPAGLLRLVQVSTSHQGQYHCDIRGYGRSPPSFLSVRGGGQGSLMALPQVGARVMVHLLVFCPYCVSTVLMLLVYRDGPTADIQPSVSMTTPSPAEEDEQLDRDEETTAAAAIEHDF